MRAVILALAAALASASWSCKSVTGTSYSWMSDDSCITGSVADSGSFSLSWDVQTDVDRTGTWEIVVWNYDQTTTFAAPTVVVDTPLSAAQNVGTELNLARITGVKVDATTNGEFGWTNAASPATLYNGKYTLKFTGVTGFTYGAMIRYNSGSEPKSTVALGTTGQTFAVPLGATSTVTAQLSADFITAARLVKSVAVSVNSMHEAITASAASLQFPTPTGSVTHGLTSVTGHTGTGARLFEKVRPNRNSPTSSQYNAVFTVDATATVMTANFINWKAPNGPFANITVGGTGDKVTEWPVITPGTPVQGLFNSTGNTWASIADTADNVWRVALPRNKLWWKINAMTSNVKDTLTSTDHGSLAIYTYLNPSEVLGTPSGTYSANVASGPLSYSNPRFASFSPTSTGISATGMMANLAGEDLYVILAPNAVTSPAGSAGNPVSLSFTLSVTMESAVLECSQDDDCITTASAHRSVRAGRSANGDATRLRHCVFVPDNNNPAKPTSRCVECKADCDCGVGQYCHMDTGVCPTVSGSSYYVCDRDSSQMTGLCIAKDPTNSIIGSSCRTSSGLTYDDGSVGVNSAWPLRDFSLSQYLVGNQLEGNSLRESQTANGFCGSVRFFNSSFTSQAATMTTYGGAVNRNNTARTVLWSGSCINGVCRECAPGASSACRTCVNGRSLSFIDVDQTSRTLGQNITASLGLGVLIMLIIICLVAMTSLWCLRSWHQQDLHQRKLKYQKVHEAARKAEEEQTGAKL